MHYNLAEALVNKGVIKYDTEVEAKCITADLSGIKQIEVISNFLVKRVIKQINGEIVFDLSHQDGRRCKIKAENVITIDGMDPSRIATVYNLKADGSEKTTGKKRGRKPKYLKQALANSRQMRKSA
jgi:hypothetical protein